MCNTMPKERITTEVSVPRPCVRNGDVKIFNYLSNVFGRHRLSFCRPGNECMFVCPRENVLFEVIESLEFFSDYSGSIKRVIAPGTYRIAKHIPRLECHMLFLEKINNGNVLDRLICPAGWLNGFMVDWRGIRPIQDK